MAIPIIRPFRRVHCERHSLVFDLREHPTSGVAIDCDAEGRVIGNEYHTQEANEAHAAQLRADARYYPPEIRTQRWSYREPAIARCYCDREIELADPLDNVCECGRCFNSSGQSVVHSSLCDDQGNPYETDY